MNGPWQDVNGHRAVTRVLDKRSYHVTLLDKLVEEAQEAESAATQDLPAELADVGLHLGHRA